MVPVSKRTLADFTAACGVFVVLMHAVVAHAERLPGNDWRFSRRAGDVELYRKAVDGSGFPAVLARLQFSAPVEEIYPILNDYSRFTGFVPNVLESRVLRRQGSTQWVYQRLRFPAPVSDRHYIIRSTGALDQPGGKTAHIDWSLDRSAMQEPGEHGVMPRDFSGSWELRSLPGDAGTQAYYQIHVDPGGRLPAWLFARLSENYVLRVMNAVIARVEAEARVNQAE